MRALLFVSLLCVSCGARTIATSEDTETSTGACPAGTTVLLPATPALRDMRALAATSEHLFIVAHRASGDSVVRVDKTTGAYTTLAASPTVKGFAVGATHAYMTSETELFRAPLTLAEAWEPIAPIRGAFQSLSVANGERVSWTTISGRGDYGRIDEWRPDGEVKTIAVGWHHAIAAADDAWFFSSNDGSRSMIWRKLRTEDLTRGREVGSRVTALALDPSSVVIATATGLLRMARDVSEPVPIARDQTAIVALALDGDQVYFADAGRFRDESSAAPDDIPGSIRRVRRTGSAVEVLAVEGRGVSSIAVDACSVFWLSDRGLVRSAK